MVSKEVGGNVQPIVASWLQMATIPSKLSTIVGLDIVASAVIAGTYNYTQMPYIVLRQYQTFFTSHQSMLACYLPGFVMGSGLLGLAFLEECADSIDVYD